MSVSFGTGNTDQFQLTSAGGSKMPSVTAGTIMGWFQSSSPTTGFNFFRCISTNASGCDLFAHAADGILRIASDTAVDAADATGALVANTWYHFAFQWSGAQAANLFAFKNGVQVITNTQGAMVDVGTLAWTGTSTLCQNIQVYNAILNQNEIQQQMRQYTPIRWFDLIGWYPMKFQSIAECQADWSTWANTAATTGAPTVSGTDIPVPFDIADIIAIPSPVISVVPILPNLGLYFSDTMLKGYTARAGIYPLWVRGQVTLPIGTQLQAGNQIQLFRLGQFNRLFWMSMDVNGGMDGGAGGAGGLQGTLTDGSNSYLLNSSNLLVNASSLSSFQSVLQSGGRFVLGRMDQSAGPLGGFNTQATDSIVFINVTQAASGVMVSPSTINFTALVF